MSQKIPYLLSYDIGIQSIDTQHQKLFDLVNKVLTSSEDATKESIRTMLSDFNSYMKEHFADEEAYMRDINYALLDEHIALHEAFIDELNNAIKAGGGLKNIQENMIKIAKKFIAHIQKEDTKIKTFLLENIANS